MNGLVELREYELVPSRAKEFMDLTKEYAGLRKELMPVQGCVIFVWIEMNENKHGCGTDRHAENARVAGCSPPRLELSTRLFTCMSTTITSIDRCVDHYRVKTKNGRVAT